MKRPTLCSIHLSTLPPKGNGINRSCPWISRLLSKHCPSITSFFFFFFSLLKFPRDGNDETRVTSNFRKAHRSPWFEPTAQISDAARSNCFILNDKMAVIRDLSLCTYRIYRIKKKKKPKTLRAYSTKGNKKKCQILRSIFST